MTRLSLCAALAISLCARAAFPQSPTRTPAPPACCAFDVTVPPIGHITCVDTVVAEQSIPDLAACQALSDAILGGAPVLGYNGTTNCSDPGNFESVCALAEPTATATVAGPTATATPATPTITRTPTITQTPTITRTPTITPTSTCGPSKDKRGVPNLSLCTTCAATPCPLGTPVPAYNDEFGRRKVATCQDFGGGGASVQVYCIPHSVTFHATPVPVATIAACPGFVGFSEDYESCLCQTTSGTGNVGCWIDRLPNAVRSSK